MSQAVLSVKNLVAGYDDIDVLRGLSFSLFEGEILGIVGPNGSGKSTLLRALTRILPVRSGDVRLRGDSISASRPDELARTMAMVPQSAILPDGFSALEITLMGRTPYLRLLQSEGPDDLQIARRSMLQTRTLGLADRPINELSGGERQRVIVARALAQQSPVLLMDEPTVHLDLAHQFGLLDLVEQFARNQSISVIAVIHDLTLAAQYCDRLIMLDDGAIRAIGSPDDVITEEVILQVYGARTRVIAHPDSGLPVVLPAR